MPRSTLVSMAFSIVRSPLRWRARGSWLCALMVACWAAPASAAGGSVQGTVEAVPAKYLGETVVYLKQVPGPAPHAKHQLDQKGMAFVPHVLAITAGDTVEFLNHDKVPHNVFTPDNGGYNLGTFKAGETRSHAFDKAGVYQQLCSIHPEMLAVIFVGQNPYHAVVDARGGYALEHVPAGTYQLAVWNSKLKAPEQTITVAEGKTATAHFALKR